MSHARMVILGSCLLGLLVLPLGLSPSRTLIAQEASPLGARVDALVENARSQHQIPGLSMAIVAGGRPVYAKGFGSASLTTSVPVTASSQYRTASVSKVFTAVAVWRLVGAGKIEPDRPARDYCSSLAPLNGRPTVRHLLAHQSGIRHTTDAEDESITGPYPALGPALHALVKEPLRFPPGSKALYTSWGYAALGCVIEGATGQSYAAAIDSLILRPAGLADTTFDTPTFASPRFSPGFRLLGGAMAPATVVDTRFKLPASGIISSVNDLAALAVALFDGTLLPPDGFGEMRAVPPLPPGEKSPFTSGWFVITVPPATPALAYNGSMEGTTAFLLIVPESRVAVALLANRERFVRQLQPLVMYAAGAAIELGGKAQ